MVKYLLIINVAVFLFQLTWFADIGGYGLITGTPQNPELLWFGKLFALVPNMVNQGYLWQLITYMFVHGGFWHIFFNMFVLWMFGVSLERVWGTKGFIQFYVVCGIAAGLSMVVFQWGSMRPVVGASGAIYGLLGAYAINWPDRLVYIWGIFPLKIKYLVMILGASDLFLKLFLQTSPFAHEAHLAGLAMGLIYAWKGNPTWSVIDWLDNKRRQQQIQKKQQEWTRRKQERQEKLARLSREADEILDRLNEVSWEELSEEKKKKVREISEELKDLNANDPFKRP